MTDATPPAAPAPVNAAPPPLDAAAEAKKKRFATWSRWGAILVGVAALIRVVALFLPHGLAECDNSSLQSNMRQTLEKAMGAVKVTSMTDIRTVSRTDKAATCQMHVTASDGSTAQMTYNLTLVNGDTAFEIRPTQ